MRASGTSLGAVCGVLVFLAILPPGGTESPADLQARFDRETNGVRKARLIEKLGDAQLEEARRAGKAGDYNAVGMTLEKYRDRSEEHTSELQSRLHLVCRLLLEKKKKKNKNNYMRKSSKH